MYHVQENLSLLLQMLEKEVIILLTLFEQSNLVNIKLGKVQHLHVQIVCMSYFDNPVY